MGLLGRRGRWFRLADTYESLLGRRGYALTPIFMATDTLQALAKLGGNPFGSKTRYAWKWLFGLTLYPVPRKYPLR